MWKSEDTRQNDQQWRHYANDRRDPAGVSPRAASKERLFESDNGRQVAIGRRAARELDWEMCAKWKMAPFHGMALLLLGIGYLLHAEPLHSERGIGKCPVLPPRPHPPENPSSDPDTLLYPRLCATPRNFSCITRSNFGRTKHRHTREWRKSFLLSNSSRCRTSEEDKIEGANSKYATRNASKNEIFRCIVHKSQRLLIKWDL